LQGAHSTQTFISQRIARAENSAELPPDADTLTSEVRKVLRQNLASSALPCTRIFDFNMRTAVSSECASARRCSPRRAPTSSSISCGPLLAPTHTTKEVPTFAACADEFNKTYVLANNKPSERSMKARILKHHLLPVFGALRLDAIKMHAIEILKADLLAKELSRKRVNNILACLGKMLHYAHEIELLEIVPQVKQLKIPQQRFNFLTFEELSRLMEVMSGASSLFRESNSGVAAFR
jgi:hypothetical protein